MLGYEAVTPFIDFSAQLPYICYKIYDFGHSCLAFQQKTVTAHNIIQKAHLITSTKQAEQPLD